MSETTIGEQKSGLGRLVYSGTCAGFAAVGILSLGYLVLYGFMVGPSGGMVAITAMMALIAGAYAAAAACVVLIPVHLILVRSGWNGPIFYVVAAFLIALAGLLPGIRGSGDFAFHVALAAAGGLVAGLVFRYLAHEPARSGPPGKLDAAMLLLWGGVIAVTFWITMYGLPTRAAPIHSADIWGSFLGVPEACGFAATTALAIAALFRRNWSASGAAWLSATGLAILLGVFGAAYGLS